jgi:4-aminobutyrate aminotransferase/(S)-3-amino-2-methylpropionate transaminase
LGQIVRRTPLPGPRSAEVLRRKEAVVPSALSVLAPVVVERAEGALIHDLDGNTFIDMSGGIGCLNVGHGNPAVAAAMKAQIDRFWHTDFSVVPYEPYVALAERLCRLAPGPWPKKAAFFNSGAEAVENAVKFARAYTGRAALVAFTGAFHGRTLLTMTLTSKVRPYKAGFGPFAPEVYRAPFPDPYRRPAGLSPEAFGEQCLDALRRMFTTHVAADSVAAVLVEPIQGEGGFVVPPPGFLPGLQALCREHGILLIADEVQTGYGRTGRMFACEHFGVAPDLICLAKSMAAGMPLSAVVGRADVLDAPGDSAIGGTYVGNPVACAAGLSVLDEIDRLGLLARAEQLGQRISRRLRAMQERYPQVGDVRGLGAMQALELVEDRATRQPAPELAGRVLRRALEGGAIYLRAGVHGNVIRLLVPLVITDAQLDEALDVLDEALARETGH